MSKHLLPSKTGLPEIANTRLANTVDFHIAATNFHSIIKTHIDPIISYQNSLKVADFKVYPLWSCYFSPVVCIEGLVYVEVILQTTYLILNGRV